MVKVKRINLLCAFLVLAAICLSACSGSSTGERAWRDASLVQGGSADAAEPQAAVNTSGTGAAVWIEDNGYGDYHVQARRWTGGGWGPIESLQNEQTDADSVQVAVDPAGNIVAVWIQYYEDGAYHVWANRYSQRTGLWGGARMIQSDNLDALQPTVAVDKAGNAVALWSQDDTTNSYNIWASRCNAANDTWSTPRPIQTGTGDARSPSAAADGAGNTLAVWLQDDDSGNYAIWASRLNGTTGTWDAPQIIQTGSGDGLIPRVAVDLAGNGIAVWQQSNPAGDNNIWANRYTAATGRWGTAMSIQTGAADAGSPFIAMNEEGSAVAVWHQDGGPGFPYNVWVNHYSVSTNSWKGSRMISPSEQIGAYPQVGLDASGNGIAVWVQYRPEDPTSGGVWASRYSSASDSWETPKRIQSGNADVYGPVLAADGSGNARVVWSQGNGTGDYNLWAAGFE